MAGNLLPMRTPRALVAANPNRFGRARAVQLPMPGSPTISDDLQTFAATFVAGFVFVSVLIG
ncbi:MAG: hypothetical protein M3438_10815 [Pseudomonadota bacterium]|nr:hypothetical protein [Sphingomonas sp.]MDQ3479623.1 hypothetical protein [Pseudomonadota bacterium]